MMRSRLTSLFLVAPLVATGIALLDSAPAAAEDTGVCSLVTRAEAGELLGAKVVKTTTKTSKANGAEECTYRTKKVQKELKRNLKISLELTVQPVTDEVRSELQNIPFDDGSRVQGLGDEAYVTKFDQVIAISGDTAVAAKLQNYRGASSKFRSVSEGAVKAALPLGQLPPPQREAALRQGPGFPAPVRDDGWLEHLRQQVRPESQSAPSASRRFRSSGEKPSSSPSTQSLS